MSTSFFIPVSPAQYGVTEALTELATGGGRIAPAALKVQQPAAFFQSGMII